MGIAGYVSVCVQLYCVGFHCLGTCFGLHGHFHNKQTTKKEQADKHTRKESTKVAKKTAQKKHKWKTCRA
jgi:sulfite exporter TauE/SafE